MENSSLYLVCKMDTKLIYIKLLNYKYMYIKDNMFLFLTNIGNFNCAGCNILTLDEITSEFCIYFSSFITNKQINCLCNYYRNYILLYKFRGGIFHFVILKFIYMNYLLEVFVYIVC